MLRNTILLFFSLVCTSAIIAQDEHNYTDHKPEYRKWLDSYILDKIEYTPKSTIFYFRFVCDNVNSGGAIFYPPGGESPWYLKGRDVDKDFEITAVKKVFRNGILVKNNVVGEAFNSGPVGATGHTVYSCEVHFQRLPDDVNTADLIEGRGQEFNRRHFNCFNIKLKTWKDDLGSEKDSKKVVKKFEKKYKVEKVTKKEAVVEEKPKEDPIVVVEEVIKEEPVIEQKPKEENKYASYKTLHSEKDVLCNEKIILDNVKFHDNSTKFKGMIMANHTLNIIFDYMRNHPKSHLNLYGHSDVFGSEERNMDLSKARVVKIQRWLSMYGIKGYRIDYEWFGSEKPLVSEGDIINRRVEIKLTCGE